MELEAQKKKKKTPRNNTIIERNYLPNVRSDQFLNIRDFQKPQIPLQEKQLQPIKRLSIVEPPSAVYKQHLRKFPRREFKFDDFVDENILHNNPRHKDLNFHERFIAFIGMGDTNDLRVLERLSKDSELYRFKLDQYKESSTARSELEKVIYEQYLREFKRRYDVVVREQDKEFEYKKWVDEYRRKIIGDRIKLDLAPNFVYDYNDYIANGANMGQGNGMGKAANETGNADGTEEIDKKGFYGDDYMIYDKNAHQGYVPQEGFILFYDYQVKLNRASIDREIPKHKQRVRLMVSMVCDSEVLVEPFEVGDKDMSVESIRTLWSVLKDKTHFNNVFVNDSTLILFELQVVGEDIQEDDINNTNENDFNAYKAPQGKNEEDLVNEDNLNKKHRDEYGFKNKYKVDYGMNGHVHDDILADRKNKVFVAKDYNENLMQVNLTKFNANYDYNDDEHGYEVRREGRLKIVVIGWTQLGNSFILNPTVILLIYKFNSLV